MTVMSSDCSAPGGELARRAEHARGQLLRRRRRRWLAALPSSGARVKKCCSRIHRFRDAVGEEENRIAGRELQRGPFRRRSPAAVRPPRRRARGSPATRPPAKCGTADYARRGRTPARPCRCAGCRRTPSRKRPARPVRPGPGWHSADTRREAVPSSAIACNSVRLTAMNSAAGIPFPETSPITNPSRFSSIRKKS